MQAMDETIAAIRANRLAQVQRMDGQKFHSLRRHCLDNMTEVAMMLDAALQDLVIDGINRTEDIVRPVQSCNLVYSLFRSLILCAFYGQSAPMTCIPHDHTRSGFWQIEALLQVLHNPGYHELENGRVQKMTSLHNTGKTVSHCTQNFLMLCSACMTHAPFSLSDAAPSVLMAVEQSSSTTCTGTTEEDANATAKKTRFALDAASAPSQADQAQAPEPVQARPAQDTVYSDDAPETAVPGYSRAVKWTRMRQGVDKMTERCTPEFILRRHIRSFAMHQSLQNTLTTGCRSDLSGELETMHLDAQASLGVGGNMSTVIVAMANARCNCPWLTW